MTDASTAHGREPTEPTRHEPFFPSEGAFSTVVPLSEVGQAPASYGGGAGAGLPSEADWAREDRRRDLRNSLEEETLVPTRASNRRRVSRVPRATGPRQSWAVTSMALVLSVVAGLAAGAYLVRSQQTQEARRPATPVVDAAASEHVTAEAAGTTEPTAAPEPAPATSAPEVASTSDAETTSDAKAASDAAAIEARAESPATKSTAPAASNVTRAAANVARASAAEPAERRVVETEPRAERRARAEAGPVRPAPKPAQREPAPRRAAAAAQPRPPRASANGRALPVSSPPPSAKSRTVIQWP